VLAPTQSPSFQLKGSVVGRDKDAPLNLGRAARREAIAALATVKELFFNKGLGRRSQKQLQPELNVQQLPSQRPLVQHVTCGT